MADDNKVKKPRARKPHPLDTVVNKLLIQLDNDLVSDQNLSSKTEEYKSIINKELELAKGVSNGDIIEFNRALNDESKKFNKSISVEDGTDIGEYLTRNSGNIYQYYNERYRNKFIESQDLAFIAKFIPSLGQAINIYKTHIISSDDLSGVVKRNISFGTALNDEEKAQITNAIETFEKENNLLYKFKNSVVKESLIIGTYYVYAPSYQKLFTEYAKTLEKHRKTGTNDAQINHSERFGFNSNALESVSFDEMYSDNTYTVCALESAEIQPIIKEIKDSNALDSNDLFYKSDAMKNFGECVATVECIDSIIPFNVLEEMPDLAKNLGLTEDVRYAFDKCTAVMEADTSANASDGTFSANVRTNGKLSSADKKHKNKFNVTGTYMKFIEAKNMIKIKILDEVVGYFYVDSKKLNKTKANITFSNAEWTNINKQSTIEKISSMLASKVAKQFSTKFVSDHVVFKKLIADCIMANGVVNTQYRIQFIPKDDVFEFKINEDSKGDGASVLKDSLWPAKLLTSIRIRKTLNYVNKSADKTIAYVRKGTADVSGRNQAQRVLRNIQESNITFGDIIGDSSLMFHKYAADGNILMPVSRSGNKLVEFERMEGQVVDMSTEYEKELENQALLASGVPPLLIEQANQADFSRAFTTAHVGFAGIVAGLQSDLETPLTALYKRIIENLDIDDRLKTLASNTIEIKLPRPRALSVQSSNEILENTARFAEQFTNLKYGEVTDENKDFVQAVRYAIVKSNAPFIDWNALEEIADNVQMEKEKITKEEEPTE
jgi:hypothetical protein